MARDVTWTKYSCLQKASTTSSYFLGVQQTVSQGWDTSGKTYFQGFSDYTFNRIAGTVYASGSQSVVDMSHPGAVYEDYGSDRKSIYGYAVRADGFWHTFTMTVRAETTTTYTYTVKDKVGTVRAAEGYAPDTKNGYTYVTTYNGYTIMQDADGDYYAYKEADKE